MQTTVCGKIKDASLYPALYAIAHLMDKVERIYFRERFVKHGDRKELKRSFLKKYGITGRQLNRVIFKLSDRVEAPGSRGKPSGGSQQHCSAGVCECFTMLEPF